MKDIKINTEWLESLGGEPGSFLVAFKERHGLIWPEVASLLGITRRTVFNYIGEDGFVPAPIVRLVTLIERVAELESEGFERVFKKRGEKTNPKKNDESFLDELMEGA